MNKTYTKRKKRNEKKGKKMTLQEQAQASEKQWRKFRAKLSKKRRVTLMVRLEKKIHRRVKDIAKGHGLTMSKMLGEISIFYFKHGPKE